MCDFDDLMNGNYIVGNVSSIDANGTATGERAVMHAIKRNGRGVGCWLPCWLVIFGRTEDEGNDTTTKQQQQEITWSAGSFVDIKRRIIYMLYIL